MHTLASFGEPSPLLEWLQQKTKSTLNICFVTRCDGAELTPLIVCIDSFDNDSEDRLQALELLLKYRADPNDCSGHPPCRALSPLQSAALKNFYSAIPVLLKYGAEMGYRWLGLTAIHYAAESWSSESIVALIEEGADFDERTGSPHPGDKLELPIGSTCLHAALAGTEFPKVGNLEETIKVLLSAGLDIDAEDEHGITALELALDIESFQDLTAVPNRPSSMLKRHQLWLKRKMYISLYESAESWNHRSLTASGCDQRSDDSITKYLCNSVIVKEICSLM